MKEVSSVSIISDTHGHIDSHIIDYLKNTDVIIHAGDICSTAIISDLHRYCDQVYMVAGNNDCLLYTSPSPRDRQKSRMPSSA